MYTRRITPTRPITHIKRNDPDVIAARSALVQFSDAEISEIDEELDVFLKSGALTARIESLLAQRIAS